MSRKTIGDPIVFSGQVIPISTAVRAGDFVFVSGQLPIRDGAVVAGGIAEHTEATLDNLAKALAEAGCDFGDVVKVTAYLTDASHFAAFNEVYRSRFPVAPPARTTVVVSLTLEALLEVEAIAYRPED